jgi:hypothetical protein
MGLAALFYRAQRLLFLVGNIQEILDKNIRSFTSLKKIMKFLKLGTGR